MGELFNTISEIKDFVAVSKAFSVDTVDPYLRPAFDKYLKRWLGADQYNQLVTNYQASALTPTEQALLPYVRRPLMQFAMYEYTPIGQVNYSDQGIGVNISDKRKSAASYQINTLQESFLEHGYDAIEIMLEFLEENESDYPLWVADEGYGRNRELIVNTAKVFLEDYNLKRGRQAFQMLRPQIKHVEQFQIIPLIGQDFYDEIKTQILADNVTTDNQKVLDFLRSAVAHFTVAEGLKDNVLTLDKSGLVVFDERSMQDTVLEKVSPDHNRLTLKLNMLEDKAKRYMDRTITFIYENIADYPTFENSDTYVDPDESQADIQYFDNKDKGLYVT